MSTIKKGLAGFSSFLVMTWLFAAGVAAAAGNNPQNEQNGQETQQHQVNPNMKNQFNYDPFFGLTHMLNMSATQKAQVAEVLKSNENQAKTIAHEMANAVVQVRKDFIEGTFNTEHFDNLVKYEREGAQLRARVMSAILPELTQEQRTHLAGVQDKVGSEINSKIDSRFSQLNDWILKNGKKAS